MRLQNHQQSLKNIFCFLLCILFISACQKDPSLDPIQNNYVKIRNWKLEVNDSTKLLMEHNNDSMWSSAIYNQDKYQMLNPSFPGIPWVSISRHSKLPANEAFKIGTYSIGSAYSDFVISYIFHSDNYNTAIDQDTLNKVHGYFQIQSVNTFSNKEDTFYLVKFSSSAYYSHIGGPFLNVVEGIISFKD